MSPPPANQTVVGDEMHMDDADREAERFLRWIPWWPLKLVALCILLTVVDIIFLTSLPNARDRAAERQKILERVLSVGGGAL